MGCAPAHRLRARGFVVRCRQEPPVRLAMLVVPILAMVAAIVMARSAILMTHIASWKRAGAGQNTHTRARLKP
jgi:hypothetical protein